MSSSSINKLLPTVVCSLPYHGTLEVLEQKLQSFCTGTHAPETVVISTQLVVPNEVLAKYDSDVRIAQDFSINLLENLASLSEEFPNCPIVTFDFSEALPQNWLHSLLEDHQEYPDKVVTHVARNIPFDIYGNVQPDSYWYFEDEPVCHEGLLPTLSNGTLFPKNTLNALASIYELKTEHRKDDNQDLWIKACLTKANVSVRKSNLNIATSKKDVSTSEETRLQANWQQLQNQFQIDSFSPWPIDEDFAQGKKEADNPIDAVITWVDGSDKSHARKRAKFQNSNNTPIKFDKNDTRYKDDGEINLCLQSLFRFAPWIRRVFIVSDNQTPYIFDWIKTSPFKDRVEIIDHKTIFKGYEQHLPTFNTRSIATLLWRIPDLSEKFLFLNDDYLLTNPVSPQDFFENDKAVLRGNWKLSFFRNLMDSLRINKATRRGVKAKAKHSTSQYVASKLAGNRLLTFFTLHNPHPFLKSSWENFAKGNPALVEQQVSFRFRDAQQFNVDSLSANLNFRLKKAIRKKDIKTVILEPKSLPVETITSMLKKASDANDRHFLCLQSLDKTSPNSKQLIFSFLSQNIGTIRNTEELQ